MEANVKLFFVLNLILITRCITCCADRTENKTSSNDVQERPLKSGAAKKVEGVAQSSNAIRYEIKSKEAFEEMMNSYKKRKSITYKYKWLQKKIVEIDGDIILGGLMTIHDKHENLLCGPLMKGSIQALEAMMFTIDMVNAKEDFLPGIKLGAYILDDCNSESYSLDQAVSFIQGPNNIYDRSGNYCIDGGAPAFQPPKVTGVISSTSKFATLEVANLLRLFKIPQVSFSDTVEFRNKQNFEYLLSTLPSDVSQIDFIQKLILPLNLSHVSILYEDSEYGSQSFILLEKLLSSNNISVAVNHKLVKDSRLTYNAYYDNVVKKLVAESKSRGVVLFGSNKEVAGVMKAVRRNDDASHFSWIISNRFANHSLTADVSCKHVEAAITLRPITHPLAGFKDYFKSLKVNTNKRNPWFNEYWEQIFFCKFPETMITPINRFAKKKCNGHEELSAVKDLEMEKELQYVSDSVLAFAYAIKAMHADLCAGVPGVCRMMKPVNGTMLLKYLKNVSFKGLSDNEFEFTANGYGPAGFEILQVKQKTPGKCDWFSFDYYEYVSLKSLSEKICFRLGEENSKAACIPPCKTGLLKKYGDKTIKCCFQCVNDTTPENETSCSGCPLDFSTYEYSICQLDPWQLLDTDFLISALVFSAVALILISYFAICTIRCTEVKKKVIKGQGIRMKCVVARGRLQNNENASVPVVIIKGTKIRETPLNSAEDTESDLVKLVSGRNYSVILDGKKY